MSQRNDATTRPWRADPLAYLIAPNDPARFLAETYEREVLIVHRDDPSRYAGLLSTARIDAYLAEADLREGMLDMADANRTLSRDDYVSENGAVDRGAVVRQHQKGATVIVNQMQNSDLVLADFCRSIERLFSCHSQTNIYLTPGASQGFGIHYDNHDVFVLQIEGEKLWRFYDRPVDNPYRGEGFRPGSHEPGAVTHEFTLKPGDCAYIPRGLMHDAQTTGDEGSLHVTVGLIVKTWADLMLEAVSQVALDGADFRRSLPAGFALPGFDRETARQTFRRLIGRIAEDARMDDAFELLIDQFIRSREADVSTALSDVTRAPQASDRHVARANALWRLAEDGERLALIAAGGDLDFAPEDRPSIESALSGRPFSAADLTCAEPQTLLRKLTAFGLIERLSDAG